MATEICIKINGDSTFSVETEEKPEEMQEGETGNGQQFGSVEEVISAVTQMLQAAGTQGNPEQPPTDPNAPADDGSGAPPTDDGVENEAMLASYRGR